MLINISSNQIWLSTKWQTRRTYGQIQHQFPQLLSDIIKRYPTDEVYIINWPGSFTNIRIGTLVINLLKWLNPKIQLYQLSKPIFFKHLSKNFNLPTKIYLFIGQKKKTWLYDLQNGTYQIINYEEISIEEQTAFDQTFEFSPYIPEEKMINLQFLQDGELFFDRNRKYFQWEIIKSFPWQKISMLTPNYMIAPNIS